MRRDTCSGYHSPTYRLIAITHAGESIVREVANQMPVGLQIFKNQRANYHVTLFHTSKIHDPRPDATVRSGGVQGSAKPCDRPSPSQVRPRAALGVPAATICVPASVRRSGQDIRLVCARPEELTLCSGVLEQRVAALYGHRGADARGQACV